MRVRAGQLFAEEVKFPLSPLHIHVVDLAVKSVLLCFLNRFHWVHYVEKLVAAYIMYTQISHGKLKFL